VSEPSFQLRSFEALVDAHDPAGVHPTAFADRLDAISAIASAPIQRAGHARNSATAGVQLVAQLTIKIYFVIHTRKNYI
jgi:hypothetical protein